MSSDATATGYSIWMIPEGQVHEELTTTFHKLSKKFKSPKFEPHITLLGGITGPEKEVISKTYRLATKIKPFAIGLKQIGYQNNYLRSLYLCANPNPQLLSVNRLAKRIYGMKQGEYLPHLSLIYAKLPERAKIKLIPSLEKGHEKEFKVNSLHLYKTYGHVSNWFEVARFSLR